jgi:hypothetical protein
VAGPRRRARVRPGKILARGISTGGYYALRIAHTHADRLFAVVAQGGGSHHMFDAGWIGATRGTGKDLVARGNRGHRGNPGADPAEFAADREGFDVSDIVGVEERLLDATAASPLS